MSNKRRFGPRKRNHMPSPAMQMYGLRQAGADDFIEKAEAEYEANMAAAKERFTDEMRESAANVALGLPAHLPDETVRILAVTRALDEVGPTKPDKAKIYEKFGIRSDPFTEGMAKSAMAHARMHLQGINNVGE